MERKVQRERKRGAREWAGGRLREPWQEAPHLQRDEVAYVGRDRVLEMLRGGVEVDDMDAPALGLAVRAHQVAVRRLAAPRRPEHERRAADHAPTAARRGPTEK